MIEVKNLVKKYGGYLAVDDLSFTVDKGQILGFLGPNGAGKSTTMNILTGYISATQGTVIINGHDIFDEPEEAKKCIGYLPELPPLYQDMTVREYLNFVSDIKLVKKSQKNNMINKIMGMTRITDVSERLIKQLSKGYKQRVGLAQAIVGFPDVLILDEPTVGLDPMQIIEIRDLIKELSKEHTIILSSHILPEISAICDRVMIINKGKLIVSDTPANLSKHFGGSNELHLEIKGKLGKIEEALQDIAEITKIDYVPGTEQGIIKLVAYSSEDVDIRETVFYALSDAGCPILGMKSSSMSLEDIFLEVTKGKESENQGSITPEDITPESTNAENTNTENASDENPENASEENASEEIPEEINPENTNQEITNQEDTQVPNIKKQNKEENQNVGDL